MKTLSSGTTLKDEKNVYQVLEEQYSPYHVSRKNKTYSVECVDGPHVGKIRTITHSTIEDMERKQKLTVVE